MAALTGKSARIKITSQTATTDATESTTLVGGTTSQYQIDDVTKRYIDERVTPVIKDGVGVVSSSKYSLDYLKGIVAMSTSATAGITVTDFSYLTSSYIANGKDWSANVSFDVADVTTFSTTATDPTWKSKVAQLGEATVSMNRISTPMSTADPQFFDLPNIGGRFVLEMLPDNSAGDKYEAFAFVSQDTIDASVEDIQTEGVTFMVDGTFAWTTST
jgi:hypothetical protein